MSPNKSLRCVPTSSRGTLFSINRKVHNHIPNAVSGILSGSTGDGVSPACGQVVSSPSNGPSMKEEEELFKPIGILYLNF
jgi:hypothetical protein